MAQIRLIRIPPSLANISPLLSSVQPRRRRVVPTQAPSPSACASPPPPSLIRPSPSPFYPRTIHSLTFSIPASPFYHRNHKRESTTSQLDPMMPSHLRRFDSTFSTSSSFYHSPSLEFNDSMLYWIAYLDAPHSSSVTIPIPPGHAQASQSPLSSSSFSAFSENSSIFPDVTPFSPTTAYAALQPLPLSPPEDNVMTEQLRADVAGTISPPVDLYGTEPPA